MADCNGVEMYETVAFLRFHVESETLFNRMGNITMTSFGFRKIYYISYHFTAEFVVV